MASKGTDSSKIGRKGGIIAIAIGIGTIIILLIVVVVMLLQNQNVKQDREPLRNRVVNEQNVDAVIAELQEKELVKPGSYQVRMNSTWTFADGKSPSGNAYVENADTNTNEVYFDIHLSDTDELIYSSPVLPLGSYLEDITLDKELSAGNYDCVMTYHLVDEEQNTISTLKMGLTIIVNE